MNHDDFIASLIDCFKNKQVRYNWLWKYELNLDWTLLDQLTEQQGVELIRTCYHITKDYLYNQSLLAYNALYNLLWLDSQLNNWNWEYSNPLTYLKRLPTRYAYCQTVEHLTTKDFMVRENRMLHIVQQRLSENEIAFYQRMSLWGPNDNVFAAMPLNPDLLWAVDFKMQLQLIIEEKISVTNMILNQLSIFNKPDILYTIVQAYFNSIGLTYSKKESPSLVKLPYSNTQQENKSAQKQEKEIYYEVTKEDLISFLNNEEAARFFKYAIDNFSIFCGKVKSEVIQYSNLYYYIREELFDFKWITKENYLTYLETKGILIKRLYEPGKSTAYHNNIQRMWLSFKKNQD